MSNEIKIFGSVNDYARDFINDPENNISKFYFELNHTLVISNNNLYAWKNKCSEQISETESKKALTPTRIKFFDGKIIRKICCGCDHRIVVCDDGVYTWGYNFDAQLGTGNFTNASSPVRIDFFNGKIIRIDLEHGKTKNSGKTKGLLIENGIEYKIDDLGNKEKL